ncbi:hypothetical protein [Streptomyces sp. NPDC060194]|uniref:hypothetical protein n=1 Tax=Streptomyces sp. NPDC060194 TaxID=3347069 RepID=UPI003646E846
MTRETDSSPSGPQGRGAAYPSGTPPYGTPQDGDAAAAGHAPVGAETAPAPDEPRTETTLTTRVRINIPGSRPIPPVVVRKSMTERERAESAAGRGEPTGAYEPVSGPARPVAAAASPAGGGGGRPAPGSAASTSGVASGGGAREKLPTRSPQASTARGGAGAPNGSGGATGAGPGAGSGSGGDEKASDWFAPRKAPAPHRDEPGTGEGPRFVRDEQGRGPDTAGGGSANGAAPGGFGAGARAAAGHQGPVPSGPAAPGPDGASGPYADTDPYGAQVPAGPQDSYTAPQPPAGGGPFAGPGTSGGPGGTPDPYARPDGAAPRPQGTLGDFTPGGGPAGAGLHANSPYASADAPSGTRPGDPFGDLAAEQARRGDGFGPDGPTTGPVTGNGPLAPGTAPYPQGVPPHGTPPHGVPGIADDTAVLTPQPPSPAGPNASGEPLTGGIPVVPGAGPTGPAPSPPGPGGPAAPAPRQGTITPVPEPPAKKKGRSKLVMAAAGVIGLAGVAYGAGLLLNHSDVPKGTTALGVDIGGSSKEEAVQKLDAALGNRLTAPLELRVGEKTVPLSPEKAGLSVNTESTVRNAAGSDYNPVSVIGSLFGGTRVAEPDIPVDDEKLAVALADVTSGGKGPGAASEGTVVFRDGKAIPSYGKPYDGVDVSASADAVAAAYRERAETGENAPVALPVTPQKPKVSDAEVDRAMKEFAKPALSGWVWLQAGGVEVPFSEKSIGEMLRMQPGTDGSLQPVIDLKVLEEKYGNAFAGVTIDGGAGEVPMNAQHAAAAMLQALKKTAPAEPEKRIASVEGAKAG